jgi:hypothetical protein
MDAALNLPEEKYSHGVRRFFAENAALLSFDDFAAKQRHRLGVVCACERALSVNYARCVDPTPKRGTTRGAAPIVTSTSLHGIHITSNSSFGKLVGNVVQQTGDDMIAVVSYRLGEPNVRPVLIEDNDVADQHWGRGIAVVGGREIRNNRIPNALRPRISDPLNQTSRNSRPRTRPRDRCRTGRGGPGPSRTSTSRARHALRAVRVRACARSERDVRHVRAGEVASGEVGASE